MQLNLKKSSTDRKDVVIQTTLDEVYEVNPVIEVHVRNYININPLPFEDCYSDPVQICEIIDWETTYYIAGEECKRDGVKELLDKLFTDLSYDKIEDAIRELPEHRFSKTFADYNLIDNLRSDAIETLLNTAIKHAVKDQRVKVCLETGMEYTRCWYVRQIAELLGDSRLQEVTINNTKQEVFIIKSRTH